jgi:hypothetical protein
VEFSGKFNRETRQWGGKLPQQGKLIKKQDCCGRFCGMQQYKMSLEDFNLEAKILETS